MSSAATVAARNPENGMPCWSSTICCVHRIRLKPMKKKITAGSVWRTCASHQWNARRYNGTGPVVAVVVSLIGSSVPSATSELLAPRRVRRAVDRRGKPRLLAESGLEPARLRRDRQPHDFARIDVGLADLRRWIFRDVVGEFEDEQGWQIRAGRQCIESGLADPVRTEVQPAQLAEMKRSGEQSRLVVA